MKISLAISTNISSPHHQVGAGSSDRARSAHNKCLLACRRPPSCTCQSGAGERGDGGRHSVGAVAGAHSRGRDARTDPEQSGQRERATKEGAQVDGRAGG